MRSLTGSFPAPRRRLNGGLLAGAWLLALALPVRAEMPEYVRTALNSFSPEPPAGWSYTLTTVRNNEARATARFDAAKPPGQQWTLLELNGRAPTTSEADQYARSRASDTTAASDRGAFQKRDIDPASVTLISENEERGEFRCAFRPEATGADKMLGHLMLRLTISKRQPHVEKFILLLTEPYSPVLGVKMHELRVETEFAPPAADRPSFPAKQSSHFLGRIFFIGTEENLVLTYSDFAAAR
jgi:hypothetical protein